MRRVIFHVDVNSAFLSWEACYRLHHLGGKQDLRKLVSAVGGDQESDMVLFWLNQFLQRSIISRLEKLLFQQKKNVLSLS